MSVVQGWAQVSIRQWLCFWWGSEMDKVDDAGVRGGGWGRNFYRNVVRVGNDMLIKIIKDMWVGTKTRDDDLVWFKLLAWRASWYIFLVIIGQAG